ncbi:hypothetical protein AAVH_05695 [Aphelenchoides avenae]|nr:hypothetical protein AAVH_05695 [Aphelenchus avenae]
MADEEAPAPVAALYRVIYLVDGVEVRVPDDFVHYSGLLQTVKESGMFSEASDEPARIPLNAGGLFDLEAVQMVLDFIKTFKVNERDQAVMRARGYPPSEALVVNPPDWVRKFFREKRWNDDRKNAVFRATNAAQYLQVVDFVRHSTAFLAVKMQSLTITKLRAFLNVTNDFSQEEWEQFQKEPVLQDILKKDGLL